MNVLLVVMAVGAYLAFLGAVVYFAARYSRRLLERKSSALKKGLEAEGARPVGEPRGTYGLYSGAEQEYEVGGKRVVANTYYVSRSHARANLRVAGGPYPAVIVYPEGKVERFGKHVGLNREVQTGDRAFDDLAYVDTIEKNDEYVQRLLAPAPVRDGIRALLGYGFRVQFSAAGVDAFQLRRGGQDVDGAHAGKAAAALTAIAEHAPGFKAEPLTKPGIGRGAAGGLFLALGWMAMLMLAGALSSTVERTLDPWAAFVAYVFAGGLGWLLFVFAVGALARGTSGAFRVVLLAAFVGLLGVPAGVGSLVLGLNQWLDGSPAAEHPTVVRKLRRNKSEYSLRVESWRDESDERISVSWEKWKQLKVGDPVVVRVHDGAFGFPWAEKLNP